MSDYIEALGIIAPKAVYKNLTPAQLVEHALRRGEGTLSETGALVVTTGKYTGRSPDDRFVVDAPNIHNDIDWGKVNVPISEEKYEAIYNRMTAYLQGRELFVFEGFAGADEQYHLPVRVVNELASQNLFIHQLLVRPTEEQLKDVIIAYEPVWAIGTGKTATSEQANEVNNYIRGLIAELYSTDAANAFVVQYGGSMNAGNAAELLAMEDIDGGLIGGASLKAPDFATIVKAASV